METRTSDLYEAAYYLSQGVAPAEITCRSLGGNVTRDVICDFYFPGEKTGELQGEYLRSEAVVNLSLFRRCYSEVINYANNSKRDYRKVLKGDRS